MTTPTPGTTSTVSRVSGDSGLTSRPGEGAEGAAPGSPAGRRSSMICPQRCISKWPTQSLPSRLFTSTF